MAEKIKDLNIVICGVGGQGTLLASRILGHMALSLGHDVKVSEVHGMSQRGGSVSSEVRYGEEVASPMVPEGESDFLIVLEPTQIEVNLHKLKAGGVLITTDDVPTDRLKTPKALNTMMLGALSAKMPDIGEELFLEVLKAFLPEKLHELNIEMFRLGRQG